MKSNNLTIGQKLHAIRKAKKMSQDTVAEKIRYSRTVVSNVERDIDDDLGTIIAIKAALGIQGMPLCDEERKPFMDKLYLWNELISGYNLEDAKQIQEELSQIRLLPFEQELNKWYSLFACRIILWENKLEEAEKMLAELEPALDKKNNTAMYWLYYNQGTLAFYKEQYQIALNFYKKAYVLKTGGFEQNKSLYFNIAYCLSNLGYYTNAVMFIDNDCEHDSSEHDSSEHATAIDLAIDSILAINLISWGYLKRAGKLLRKCLLIAQKNKDDTFIGSIYHNLGILHFKNKNWETALSHYDKAFGYIKKSEYMYLQNLYQKARCLIEIDAYSQCLQLINEGKELSKDNENFSILFESLNHLMTPSQDASLKYLETTAIPYLLNKSVNVAALDYCEILYEYYKKVKQKTKRLKMAEMCATMYKNANEMGVVE